ncbi:MAG: hypothetical protein ABIJ82_00220 [Patescibacteria group bacterium]
MRKKMVFSWITVIVIVLISPHFCYSENKTKSENRAKYEKLRAEHQAKEDMEEYRKQKDREYREENYSAKEKEERCENAKFIKDHVYRSTGGDSPEAYVETKATSNAISRISPKNWFRKSPTKEQIRKEAKEAREISEENYKEECDE